MATQEERREKTRQALLTAARKLFLELGYAETSTNKILEAAGVSKGALYHHFKAKEDIMEAIYASESERAIAAAQRAVPATATPLAQLRESVRAWMKEIRRPETARILMELGPQALGWRRAKAIEEAGGLAALTRALEAAKRAGEIDPPSIEIAARLLNALLTEATLLHLQHAEAALEPVEDGIDRFLESLRPARRDQG